MGAKKKESTNFDALWISEGDCVSVENHGKHWIHLGYIISIDKSTKTAVVKWEETRKKDTVHLGDCKKYNKLYVIPRKWKSTDFFCEIPQTKRGKTAPGQMKNMFFLMKTCQSYAPKVPFKTYWTCYISCQKKWIYFGNWPHQICLPLWNHWIRHSFPRAVLSLSLGINLIQKCLWILCKKFKFQTTKKAFSVFEAIIESASRN